MSYDMRKIILVVHLKVKTLPNIYHRTSKSKTLKPPRRRPMRVTLPIVILALPCWRPRTRASLVPFNTYSLMAPIVLHAFEPKLEFQIRGCDDHAYSEGRIIVTLSLPTALVLELKLALVDFL